MTWRERIRELVGAGVLIAALGAGVVLSHSPAGGADVIRVGAFNIQVFGDTKAGNLGVMGVLARVAREFDVLLVQEVRDADHDVADGFPCHADCFTVPDPDDRFEREPLVARFQAGGFDFRLVGVHIKPDDAFDELPALAEVAETIADSTEGDVILLGDFNADCSYLNENDAAHPFRAAAYHWVIENSVETAVKSGCTYDRIVLLDGTFGREYVPQSAQVFRYDQEFGITDPGFVARVSDHFPVFAEFRITGSGRRRAGRSGGAAGRNHG